MFIEVQLTNFIDRIYSLRFICLLKCDFYSIQSKVAALYAKIGYCCGQYFVSLSYNKARRGAVIIARRARKQICFNTFCFTKILFEESLKCHFRNIIWLFKEGYMLLIVINDVFVVFLKRKWKICFDCKYMYITLQGLKFGLGKCTILLSNI